ncbi:hypothetical protein RN51_01649 [Microbacterium oxydans]|uniref:Replication protein n=1 Tax=Microbacterium oxydans TaxID=82380 RepID=A0A0F0KR08_9MICO|nr:hypothetical protein [Microbacterium oxydans]KJL22904.1 hypothetical protein RN51_01649 [Microbacterium oxydans]
MHTKTSYAKTLERNADKSPEAQILALLCTPKNDAHKVRSWLLANGSFDHRQIAHDDTKWLHLVQAARKHRATSQKTIRQNTNRRMVSHVLRSYPDIKPLRARKARLIAAVAGSEMLAAAEAWDTWLVNQHDLAVKLGVSRPTVRKMLQAAVDLGVLAPRARAKNGQLRFFLREWPTAHTPTEVECLASASIDRGAPNEVAQWILSAAHPAWAWSAKPDEPGQPYLTHTVWERRVLNAAGIRRMRGKRWAAEVALAPFPGDLDLCLDAVAEFSDAWERREEEAAARKEAVATHRALNDEAMADLRSRNWPPAKGQLSPWIREVRISLASRPVAPELTTAFDSVLKRALKNRYSDKAKGIFAAIREDVFA